MVAGGWWVNTCFQFTLCVYHFTVFYDRVLVLLVCMVKNMHRLLWPPPTKGQQNQNLMVRGGFGLVPVPVELHYRYRYSM